MVRRPLAADLLAQVEQARCSLTPASGPRAGVASSVEQLLRDASHREPFLTSDSKSESASNGW